MGGWGCAPTTTPPSLAQFLKPSRELFPVYQNLDSGYPNLPENNRML